MKNEEEIEKIIFSHSAVLRNYLFRAEKRIKKGNGITHKNFWEKLEKIYEIFRLATAYNTDSILSEVTIHKTTKEEKNNKHGNKNYDQQRGR